MVRKHIKHYFGPQAQEKMADNDLLSHHKGRNNPDMTMALNCDFFLCAKFSDISRYYLTSKERHLFFCLFNPLQFTVFVRWPRRRFCIALRFFAAAAAGWECV